MGVQVMKLFCVSHATVAVFIRPRFVSEVSVVCSLANSPLVMIVSAFLISTGQRPLVFIHERLMNRINHTCTFVLMTCTELHRDSPGLLVTDKDVSTSTALYSPSEYRAIACRVGSPVNAYCSV
jgi:hypothetical protein